MPNSALVVMDVQNGVVERFAENAGPLLGSTARAVAAARAAGVPVIYVRVGFRPGLPEVSARNKAFSAIAGSMTMGIDEEATQVHPAVAPQPGDIVVVKKRVSAFAGSDLDVVLRAMDIRSVALSGIATSGVVLSTLRQAADMDYQCIVLSDCCADSDPEVHRVLLEKVFPRQADVVTASDWAQSLSAQ